MVWLDLKRLTYTYPVISYDLILLLGIYPREVRTCPQKDMNKNVQSVFINNNQKLETTQMFINRKKQILV